MATITPDVAGYPGDSRKLSLGNQFVESALKNFERAIIFREDTLSPSESDNVKDKIKELNELTRILLNSKKPKRSSYESSSDEDVSEDRSRAFSSESHVLSGPPHHRKHPIDDKILVLVKKFIGRDWKDLGRAMSIEEDKLDELGSRESSMDELAYSILTMWKENEKNNATIKALIECLTIIGRTDLVHKILCHVSSPEMPLRRYYTAQGTKSATRSMPNNTCFNSHQRPRGVLGWISEQHKIDRNSSHLRRKLVREYREIRINGLHWMGHRWSNLSMDDYYVELTLNNDLTTNGIKLEDIFNTNDDDWKPLKVLIEGHSGYGKTTLASKMCYDWSLNKENYLQSFDIVLFIPLQTKERSLKEMLVKATCNTWNNIDTLWAIINDPTKRILFILDGHEGTDKSYADTVRHLLRGDLLPHVTMVVTAKPGSFRRFATNAPEGVAGPDTTEWHQQITIKGVTENKRKVFVNKCMQIFSGSNTENMKYVISRNISADEMFDSPLILLMAIAIATQPNENLYNVHTITDLYKIVFNMVASHYLQSLSESENRHSTSMPDVFSLYVAQEQDLSDTLKEFCKTSLEAVKTGDCTHLFESDPNQSFYGIVVAQEEYLKSQQPCLMYEPIHGSLIEFAAAYYLWLMYHEETHEQWQKRLSFLKLNRSFLASYTFPFLHDLLGHDSEVLFDTETSQDEYKKRFTFPGFKPWSKTADPPQATFNLHRRHSYSTPSIP